jgi:hypothetical protein
MGFVESTVGEIIAKQKKQQDAIRHAIQPFSDPSIRAKDNDK